MMPVSARRTLRFALTGIVGRASLWLWGKTTRFKVQGDEPYRKLRAERRPVILLIWHGKILHAPYFFRGRGMMPLVSPSEDGEIIARIIDHWGYKTLRGSGSHVVAKAWQEMLRELRAGGELIIVTDGPRGPDRVLKAGCIRLAQETNAALVPFTFAAAHERRLKSWDRFMLTRPIGRVIALYGAPLTVAGDVRGDALEAERLRVEKAMLDLEEEAESLARRRPTLDFS